LLKFFVDLIYFKPFGERLIFPEVNILNQNLLVGFKPSKVERFDQFLSFTSQLGDYRFLNAKYLSNELLVRFESVVEDVCESFEVNNSAFEVFRTGKCTKFVEAVQRGTSAILNADAIHLRGAFAE
jgi:hypothetical protein